MIRLTIVTALAAGIFSLWSAFAGDAACCAHAAGSDMKTACAATFAQLDLNAEQRSRMETLAAECDKTGCSKESMAKMEQDAKKILSEDQFVAWRAACAGHHSEKKQS